VLDVALDEAQRHDGREKFVQLALADTDARVANGRPVAPSFMLASMLWHDVQIRWQQQISAGEPAYQALQQAIDAVFDARIGDISGRGRLAADMREIWMMQPRLERRAGNAVLTMVEQPRFRAGLDFLRLRGEAGEVDPELARWWEAFAQADADERHRLLGALRGRDGPRRVPRREAEVADTATEAAASETVSAPARKRRRRRRKPGGGSAEAETVESAADPERSPAE